MTLAVIADPGGRISVDVRDDAPLAAGRRSAGRESISATRHAPRREALEQQLHLDGIDRGDPEAVADGALAADPRPCTREFCWLAVVDDVQDDQEVTGQIELLDEIEARG